MISISQFFNKSLGAPLRNMRWSWGAVNPKTQQLFLRVWEDDRRTVDGIDQVQIWKSDARKLSQGGRERQKHVEWLQRGSEGYGVVCVAKGEKGERREIERFVSENVLKFGRLIQRGSDLYATVAEEIPVEELRRGLSQRQTHGIPDGITAEDIREALRRLAEGVRHGFGPSTLYDVLYEGRRYPPKAVVGLAAERLAGRILTSRDFQSGSNKEAFRILTELGFGPVPKLDDAYKRDQDDEEAERQIKERKDISETEKLTLIKARRGQGLYRANLELVEERCRLTGLSDVAHLRASHIKPWCKCTHEEKLDGNNGLLLSPHIDHLFDRGYITFEDDGTVLASKSLPAQVLARWKIRLPRSVGAFRPEQRTYLDYHRRHVFKKKRK